MGTPKRQPPWQAPSLCTVQLAKVLQGAQNELVEGGGTLFQYRRGGRGRQGFVMNLKPEIRAWVQ